MVLVVFFGRVVVFFFRFRVWFWRFYLRRVRIVFYRKYDWGSVKRGLWCVYDLMIICRLVKG